jgi:hypothetical protein
VQIVKLCMVATRFTTFLAGRTYAPQPYNLEFRIEAGELDGIAVDRPAPPSHRGLFTFYRALLFYRAGAGFASVRLCRAAAADGGWTLDHGRVK